MVDLFELFLLQMKHIVESTTTINWTSTGKDFYLFFFLNQK